MSKYEEAKGYIDMIWSEPRRSRVDINWLAIEQIKEMLDKEKPMKPIIKSGGIERCGKCKYQYDQHNDYYCSHCGQCRDWGDEE